MSDIDDAELRMRATQRVDAKLAFRSHLFTYVIVVTGLAVLNMLTNPGYLWFLWVAFGWGLAVVSHGVSVYGLWDGMREREIEAEIARLRSRR